MSPISESPADKEFVQWSFPQSPPTPTIGLRESGEPPEQHVGEGEERGAVYLAS